MDVEVNHPFKTTILTGGKFWFVNLVGVKFLKYTSSTRHHMRKFVFFLQLGKGDLQTNFDVQLYLSVSWHDGPGMAGMEKCGSMDHSQEKPRNPWTPRDP